MADNDKQFIRVIGNVGRKPARSERREDIVEFSIAQSTGYDDNDEAQWFNVAVGDRKPHLQQFALQTLQKGSKGVYVEGYGTIKEVNGKTYRDMFASRIGLLEFVTAESAPAAKADDDDY